MSGRYAEVLFPTPGTKLIMNRVSVRAYPDRHHGIKACPFDEKVADVKHQLGYSRDGEDIETINMDVVVQFEDRRFEGQSFGLALALADKIARAGMQGRQLVICATGKLEEKGAVSPIELFAEKVAIADQHLKAGDVFVFPAMNGEEVPEGLGRLKANGIFLRPVTELEDVRDLWALQVGIGNYRGGWPWSSFLKGGVIGFIGLMLVILLALVIKTS